MGKLGEFTTYCLQVPPERLWYVAGADGTKRVKESPHYMGAVEILAGKDPAVSTYAKRVTQKSDKYTHGNPDKFRRLIGSIKSGWHGDPIIGAINRRGEIVIHDGFHRSAAALACGLQVIPVKIHYRSDVWWAFKHAMKDLNGGAKLYQPFDHPDFYFWPCWRIDTFNRIEVIADHLESIGAHTASDVGCHCGTISHGIARRGFEVTGHDINEKAIKAARLMGTMSDIGSNARFHVEGINGPRVDAVVCLSVLNHYHVKADDDRSKTFINMLRDKAPVIILDCPTGNDPVGGDSAVNTLVGMGAWLTALGFPGKMKQLAGKSKEFQRDIGAYTWHE